MTQDLPPNPTLASFLTEAQGWHRLWLATREQDDPVEPDVLAAMIQHYLDQPASALAAGQDTSLREQADDSGASSVRSCLMRSPPSRDELVAVKDLAKSALGHADPDCPPPIAHALYYLALAAAHVQGWSISSYPIVTQSEGFRWCLAQSWLPEDARGLLAAALGERSP